MGELSLAALNLDWSSIFLLTVTVLAFLVPVVIILPPVGPSKSDALLQTHSLAGVAAAKSNLKSQYAVDAHSVSLRDGGGVPPKIQALMIYPVKSCKGIEVTKARVLPQGLEFDRLFTFAQLKSQFPAPVANEEGNKTKNDNGHSWTFITQRQFARLATVTVELWLPDEMKLRKQSMAKTSEAFLILRFPWRERGLRGLVDVLAARLTKGLLSGVPEVEVMLPVDYPSPELIKARGYTYEDVTIWRDTVPALNLSRELPDELRLYLGVSNKLGLFRIDPGNLRDVRDGNAPKKEAIGWQPVAAFQDAYPLHVQNLSSVQTFSEEVPKDGDLKELSVLRFRPNLIVSGAATYEEDTWKRVRLDAGSSGLYNPVLLDISCRTVRCKLPNVDPETGDRHPVQPDKSLRSTRDVDPGAPRSGCLGVQACPLFEDGVAEEDREGWIGIGMEVHVQERGEHQRVKE